MSIAETGARQESQPTENTPSLSVDQRPGTRRSTRTLARFSRRRWSLLLRVTISVALLALLVAKANIRSFISVLLHIDPLLAALGLGVGVVTIVLSAWQWQILLKHEQIKLSLPFLTSLYFVGHTFSQLLPSSIGGDVAMAAYVARLSKRDVGAASATLMARVIGLLALLVTAIPIAVIAAWLVPSLGWSLTLFLLAAAALYTGGLAVLLTSPSLLRRIGAQRFGKYRLGRKVLELAETVALYRNRPAVFVTAGLVSFIFYVVSTLNHYYYGLALHLRSPFWFYWLAVAVTSLATLLPISLNGYGVRGASFVLVFALIGVPAATSLSFSLAIELQRLIFALVGGVVLLLINRQAKLGAPPLRAVRLFWRRSSMNPRASQQEVLSMESDQNQNESKVSLVDGSLPIDLTPTQKLPRVKQRPFKAPKGRQGLPGSRHVLFNGSKGRRRLLISMAGLMVLAFLLTFLGLRLAKGTPHVTVYTVHAQMLTSTVGGGGLTYPLQLLAVAYPVSAQVIKVDVQVGDVVQPGQPLITLDTAGLTAQLEQAYNQWQIAQDYVDQLRNSGASYAQIAAAQQQAAVAKNRYDTLNSLINSSSFNHGNIIATFKGVVTAINVTAGTLFNANTTLLTLEDISQVIVHAQFPLEQRAQVQLNELAEVDPAATPGQHLIGQVTAINPALTNPGGDTFEVWITVSNLGMQLFTGESVYARVQGRLELPTVPELAVINPESDSIVFLYSGGKAHIRHVVVGVRDGDKLGIVSGLEAGDQIILTGQYQLSDDEPVIVSATER